jgi:8-oxo-dGTP pyrophosphatase MutT (NUDIX family)
MFVAALVGLDNPPAWLSDGPTTLLIYATLAYGLGVVVDGAADELFTAMLKLYWWRQPGAKPNPIARTAVRALSPRDHNGDVKVPLSPKVFERLRETTLLRDDGLAKFMEYQRSRQRIARATTLNLLILLPVGIWFLTITVTVGPGVVIGFTVAVPMAAVISGRAAERLRDRYEGHLRRLPALGTDPLAWIRAAAVCAHATGNGPEVLVVRTKEPGTSPERWTFPKGHVERGETLLDAAMREAEEEAGVKGVVDPNPLPPYVFPGEEAGRALVVIPFLMEIRENAEPTEPGRMMRWCRPEEATALLRLHREDPFTNEHDRVIDGAIRRLGSRRPLRSKPPRDT